MSKTANGSLIPAALMDSVEDPRFIEGHELATKHEHDGIDIMAVAAYALEDANFHDEAAKIRGMMAEAFYKEN